MEIMCIMDKDVKLLCELIIEYESNQNAAGEYNGHDPRLLYETSGNIGANDIIWLAKKILREENEKQVRSQGF